MKFIKWGFISLLAAVSLLSGCEIETPEPVTDEAYGEVSFVFNIGHGAAGGRAGADSLSDVTDVILTIKKADGTSTDYRGHVAGVVQVADHYASVPVSLPAGNFQITNLQLLNAGSAVIFAAPMAGSSRASDVISPMPVSFTIADSVSTNVQTEVLPTYGTNPDDFGFVLTPPNWPSTITFQLAAVTAEEPVTLLAADLNVASEDNTYIYDHTLEAVSANTVTINSLHEQYTLSIISEGYLTYTQTFSLDSLLKHEDTPLTVALEEDLCRGGTFQGELILDSQERVDSIGQYCYAEITGGLIIRMGATGTPVSDLTPLAALTTVGENLYIDGLGLTSLEGLHNLTGVGGVLTVSNLPNITSFTGLRGLTSLGSKLVVGNNAALENFDGLQGLTSLVNQTYIYENPALKNFVGLENVTEIEYLDVTECDELTSMQGLHGLRTAGTIRLTWLEKLTSLAGFANALESLGNLELSYNSRLSDLGGMFSVDGKLNGSLSLNDNGYITSLAGLSFNPIVKDIFIVNNLYLNDLSALADIVIIDQELQIMDNPSLYTLTGLQSLVSAGNESGADQGYEVTIYFNDALENYCALSNLVNNGVYYKLNILYNGYNPTVEDIENGTCSAW